MDTVVAAGGNKDISVHGYASSDDIFCTELLHELCALRELPQVTLVRLLLLGSTDVTLELSENSKAVYMNCLYFRKI